MTTQDPVEAAFVERVDARRERDGSRNLCAYYYGFDSTGCDEIDRLLAAVAAAGKAYHYTESWSGEGPEEEVSYVDLIQFAANRAAAALAKAREEGREAGLREALLLVRSHRTAHDGRQPDLACVCDACVSYDAIRAARDGAQGASGEGG